MTSEGMSGREALTLQQVVHLRTEDGKFQAVGKLAEIGGEFDFLSIEMEQDDREYVNAPAQGTEILCAAQGDNCVYRFPARFRSSSALPEKKWYLDFPEEVLREQMRRFVRIPVPSDMGLKVKLPNGIGSLRRAKEMTICNISGSGICFASDQEAPVGSKISVCIDDLPGYGELRTTATVRRCTQIRFLNHYVYHIGAHMEEHISEKQQDKLVRALFQLQQQYLKKGVGVV